MGHDPLGWFSLEWPVRDRAGCVHILAGYSAEVDEGWLETDSKFVDLASVESTLADSTWVGRKLGAYGSLIGTLVRVHFGRVHSPLASLIQWTLMNDGYC